MIGDIVSRVLTEYRADTSEHKAAVKELKGEEQALAKAELEAAEARNQQFEDWIGGLAKIGVSFMAVKELGDVVWEGYKDSIHEARLETAAAGVDIEKLSAAAGGLHTHLQLLEFAAKANNGAFRLSQEQMETAEKAMHALEQRGVPTQDAINAVTEAVVTGRTRGLEPYGILIDKHIHDLQALGEENMTLMQKYELHTRVLQALKVEADGVSDSQNAIGESMEQTQVQLANSWSELKKNLGQLAVAFQPVLEALSKALSLLSDVAKVQRNDKSDHPYLRAFVLGGDVLAAEDAVMNVKDQVIASEGPGVGGLIGALDEGIQRRMAQAIGIYEQATEKKAKKMTAEALKQLADAQALAILHSATTDTTIEQRADSTHPFNAKTLEKLGLAGAQFNQEALADTTPTDEFGAPIDPLENALKGLRDKKAADAKAQQQKQQKFLEKTFGPLSDFDAYHEAFKALSGAVSSALGAWIDGSESAGQAFKRFIAEALKGLASQMLVESLKHAAYALGSLAFGDFPGAAAHGAASAAFGVGAIAAAEAAKELGGSSPRSMSKGGGAGVAPSTAGGSGNQQGPIIVIGDAFADDSPRMRALKSQQLVSQALGTSAASYQ